MSRNKYYRGPVSGHFDGERFFNPEPPSTDRSLGELLRWKLGAKPAIWPASVAVRRARPEARISGIRVTMVGHATLLIQTGGFNVLTDPVWSPRASPVRFLGPRRVTEPGIAFERLPPIDAVLLSHNHYDHLDTASLRRLHQSHRPLIVTPLGNDSLVRRAVPEARIVAGDWGDSFPLGKDCEVSIVPAHHWSARNGVDRRRALWGGFMLRSPAGLVYFAGDTAFGDGALFRAIRARHGAPDVALLPIGAYAPRWFMAAQHADPEEAVAIMQMIGAGMAIGIHWGCFQLTGEAREEPAMRLRQALQAAGIAETRFPAAQPGELFEPVELLVTAEG